VNPPKGQFSADRPPPGHACPVCGEENWRAYYNYGRNKMGFTGVKYTNYRCWTCKLAADRAYQAMLRKKKDDPAPAKRKKASA